MICVKMMTFQISTSQSIEQTLIHWASGNESEIFTLKLPLQRYMENVDFCTKIS